MQDLPKTKDQPHFFLRYLSLAPILAIIATSVAFTAWLLINAAFPDLISLPLGL